MGYAPDHKSKTHERIVSAAAKLFRRDGYSATGVDRLMHAAGLTRGGFYAHFRDKAALLVEAIDSAFEESKNHLLSGKLSELKGREWRRAASERYLAASHRDEVATGCAIPALGAEVARSPLRVRRRFTANVESLVAASSERLGGDRRQAIALLSSWIGALLLARAVSDPKLSAEILSAARDHWER